MTDPHYIPESPDGVSPVSDALLAQLWHQFNLQFPSEQHCLEELYKRCFSESRVMCRVCGTQLKNPQLKDRAFKCNFCRQTSWLTSGTFFQHVRIVRPWFAAIWLMERGVIISSSRFHRLVGIAYSTAWNIFKKLTTVIDMEMR